jgi:hypothetical protein
MCNCHGKDSQSNQIYLAKVWYKATGEKTCVYKFPNENKYQFCATATAPQNAVIVWQIA